MALSAFCEDVIDKVAVDFDNTEIKDIASAVDELLQRYAKKTEERGRFKISHLHACGSMVEKTALWKSHPKYFHDRGTLDTNYIEFDYLAILEKPDGFIYEYGCPACMQIKGIELAKTAVDKQITEDKPTWLYNHPSIIDKEFHSDLISGITSLCNCYTVGECGNSEKLDLRNDYTIIQNLNDPEIKCTDCTVYRKSGFLNIAISTPTTYGSALEPKRSSLVLNWTSKTKELLTTNTETLQRSGQIDNLKINIDLLPAFHLMDDSPVCDGELKHKCFLVAKKCSLCVEDGTWRVSYSQAETDAILNKLSTNHRKCYMLIKYICEQSTLHNILASPLNGYHIKTAILDHDKDCSNDMEDLAACVFEVIGRLRSAYSCNRLNSFIENINLIRLRETDADYLMCDKILKILKAINSESHDIKDAIWSLRRIADDTAK